MIAVFAIYFTLPWIALSALPVALRRRRRDCTTLLGVAKEDGGYASDPMLGIVQSMELGALQAAAELYVGILAVTILVAATNAGVLGVSRLVYSMGMHRQMPDGMRRLHPRFRTPYLGILVVLGGRLPGAPARPGRLPRRDLRVRRDALVLDGAPRAAAAARDPARRRAPLPQPGQRPDPRPRPAAARAGRSRGDRALAARRLRARPHRRRGGQRRGWLLGIVVYVVYRRRQGLDLVSTHKVAIAEPVVDHEAEYDSVLVHVGDGQLRRAADRDRHQARGPPAPRHPRARHHHRCRTRCVIDAPMPEAEAAADSIIEQARLQGGRRVSGHWEKVRAGQAGRRIIEEAQDMRAAAVVIRSRRGSPGRRCSARRWRPCWPSGRAA